MKQLLKSCIVAFSMYSKIPMPRVKWDTDAMSYSYVFFPMIGICIGVLEWIWRMVFDVYALSTLLYAAVATAIPILLTGGIHIDGFVDTIDAIASYAPREKKLAILKDPHTGAFSVLYLGILLLVDFGFWGQAAAYACPISAYLAPFFAARCVGALLVLCMPSATGSGTAYIFSRRSKKATTIVFLCIWLVLSALLLFWSYAVAAMLPIALACIMSLWLSRYFAREFGGVTGDLAGFSITICERILLFSCILLSK